MSLSKIQLIKDSAAEDKKICPQPHIQVITHTNSALHFYSCLFSETYSIIFSQLFSFLIWDIRTFELFKTFILQSTNDIKTYNVFTILAILNLILTLWHKNITFCYLCEKRSIFLFFLLARHNSFSMKSILKDNYLLQVNAHFLI